MPFAFCLLAFLSRLFRLSQTDAGRKLVPTPVRSFLFYYYYMPPFAFALSRLCSLLSLFNFPIPLPFSSFRILSCLSILTPLFARSFVFCLSRFSPSLSSPLFYTLPTYFSPTFFILQLSPPFVCSFCTKFTHNSPTIQHLVFFNHQSGFIRNSSPSSKHHHSIATLLLYSSLVPD